MATTKKTTAGKKTATTVAKKAAKSVASKVAEAAVTAVAAKAVKGTTTKTVKKTTAKKKHAYIFFNCNDDKDAVSMNPRYNNEVFADSAAGRKALLQRIKDEVNAGRVNVSDKKAVEEDILQGNPTDASEKLQYGDIERMIFLG
ncbi:hypothetical protein [Selenomonas sp.]|uniref:hypothetical protein n=1 Tax=Selenomonas sp. TaxID=2053611 RepID=UPI0025EB7676|nr:hypothetical protein [Selenomonas sp.]